MALTLPIRDGVEVAASTNTTLLTQTTGKDASVFVKAVNKGSTTALIRIAIRLAGASLVDAHYDVYDLPLPATSRLQVGPYSLLGTDVITVWADSADVTFRYDGWSEE